MIEIIKENCGEWKVHAKSKEIKIHLAVPEKPVILLVDKVRFTQIFFNLISNAVKFSSEHGKIEVRVEEIDNAIKFAVQDNGIGITEEDIPKLFNKFQQVGRTYGGGMKGTGLGLSIVKSLVEMHGGEVRVESQPRMGTTLSFTLPRQSSVPSVDS